jgi:hypothetical protein
LGSLPSRDSLHVALRVNTPNTPGKPLSVTIPFKNLSRDLLSSRATTTAEYSTMEASISLVGMRAGITLHLSIAVRSDTSDTAVDPREWGSGMTGAVELVQGTPAPGGHPAAPGSTSVIKGMNWVIIGRGNPVMDGSMDGAWTSAAVIRVQRLKQGPRQDTGLGAENSFRLLWDDSNLYVLAEVQDPTPDVTCEHVVGKGLGRVLPQ